MRFDQFEWLTRLRGVEREYLAAKMAIEQFYDQLRKTRPCFVATYDSAISFVPLKGLKAPTWFDFSPCSNRHCGITGLRRRSVRLRLTSIA